ncbi:MAG: hypothetical protein GSR86_04470 [Desulfurococcales archaeon]|nr:hypothetical protein [Desulfurococcales archaeon]
MGDRDYTCSRACIEYMGKTRILGIDITINESWTPGGFKPVISLLVKSLSMPSIDEVPIIQSILDSIAEKHRINIYEYEPLSGSTQRADRLVRLIESSLASGWGLSVVVPSLFPVALVSRLQQRYIETLENGLLAEVGVTYSNHLYLPESGEIEIVAKANSMASYERVEWLKMKAEEEGIKVTGVRHLENNNEILKYVTRHGIETIYKSVPVTKLASMIIILARCLGLEGLKIVEKQDTSHHLLYLIGVEDAEADNVLKRIKRMEGLPLSSIWGELVRSQVERGCSNMMSGLVKLA